MNKILQAIKWFISEVWEFGQWLLVGIGISILYFIDFLGHNRIKNAFSWILKKIRQSLAIMFFGSIILLFLVQWAATTWNPATWNAYANVKQAQVSWNVIWTFLPFAAFDWLYPGNTVASIVDVHGDSDWKRILIAAGFMSIVLIVTGYVVCAT